MLRRRRRPPVLAEIPPRPPGVARPGRLSRRELDAFAALLDRVGAARVVTVAGDGGRSSVAVGLAVAAAAAARRAVLVEADLAHPRLASALGLADAPGLTEYLRSEAEASEILQPLILAGPVAEGAPEPLICVVAGAPTSEGPALLGSEGFRHAIARMRSAYDIVVIDGPPDHADGSLLAVSSQADRTIASCTLADAKSGRWDGVAGLVLTG